MKLSKFGRPSGGVAVYVSNNVTAGVKRICCEFSLGIILLFSGDVFKFDYDFICFFL